MYIPSTVKGNLEKKEQEKKEEKRVKSQTEYKYVTWIYFYKDCDILESFLCCIKNNMADQKDKHVDKMHD